MIEWHQSRSSKLFDQLDLLLVPTLYEVLADCSDLMMMVLRMWRRLMNWMESDCDDIHTVDLVRMRLMNVATADSM